MNFKEKIIFGCCSYNASLVLVVKVAFTKRASKFPNAIIRCSLLANWPSCLCQFDSTNGTDISTCLFAGT